MIKKIVCALLSVVMAASILCGCGASSDKPGAGMKVALCMPNKTSERWANDCANMKDQLEELGYKVYDFFAENDTQKQISQIEEMIEEKVDCIVITSVDAGALTTVEAAAKNAGIPIIAYDRLLVDTEAVSYYATFDNKGSGMLIGETIVEKADLPAVQADGGSLTIEFFMGSPDDNNAVLIHEGLLEVLQPYLDDGTLVCKSGKTSFEDTAVWRWSQEMAEGYLAEFYVDEELDIVASAFDGMSYGVASALENAGYTEDNWPVISGLDGELAACKNIVAGKQSFSVFKDTRLLASKCVTMVNAVCNGAEPEINDKSTYHNGEYIVPSYLCSLVVVDADNLQEVIIDSGYYTQKQLED